MNLQDSLPAPVSGPSRPVRRPLALAIRIGGSMALCCLLVQMLVSDPRIAQGFMASLLAGSATGIGALVLPFVRQVQLAQLGRFMAFGGGMMLAAALVPLLTPAFTLSTQPWAWDVLVAMGVGIGTMALLNALLPHLHAAPQQDETRLPINALWLMVVAIAVHNLPEGFAVGAGFSGGETIGWHTTLSIALQNIPEGLIVASALWSLKLPKRTAALGALLTGLVEPLGALAGATLAVSSAAALPPALGFAGAAMIYIVLHELLPEAQRLIRSVRQTATVFVPVTLVVGLLMHWAE